MSAQRSAIGLKCRYSVSSCKLSIVRLYYSTNKKCGRWVRPTRYATAGL